MFRQPLALAALWAVLTACGVAEVVEEETWYNADGQVVKTVKRTLTGEDARPAAAWEPQWVIRERERERGTRTVRYSSGDARSYGYGSYWGTGYSYYSPGRSCYRPRPQARGFTGYYRSGSSGARWGVSYRSPGVSIRYCR